MEKQILFIDMDDTIADFCNSEWFETNYREQIKEKHRYPHEMHEEGFFYNLDVMEGATSAIHALVNSPKYDCYVLSKPVRHSPNSYYEKAIWINKHFPPLVDKMVLSQNKTLLAGKGRILIDDDKDKWGDKWEKAGGEFYHFNYERDHKTMWNELLEYLL